MILMDFVKVEKGTNPVLMREGIEFASKEVANHILNKSRKVETNTDIASVAGISSR